MVALLLLFGVRAKDLTSFLIQIQQRHEAPTKLCFTYDRSVSGVTYSVLRLHVGDG
jgi:hypothetical protein